MIYRCHDCGNEAELPEWERVADGVVRRLPLPYCERHLMPISMAAVHRPATARNSGFVRVADKPPADDRLADPYC